MTVYLVGAGPGDADLLTLKAARLLSQAEVVVHDRLVDHSILAMVRGHAELIDVGKQEGGSGTQALINELLISLGRDYDTVVRLKGGDPYLFGRGGEEAAALIDSGVPFEVVPGVTSALSAPLAAGIPVTHRGIAGGVTVVTGHTQDGRSIDLTPFARGELTLVVLMGIAERERIARELIDGGCARDTPVAIVESSWTESERVIRGSLDDLAAMQCSPPAVIVIGRVAALDLVDAARDAVSAR